LVAAMLLAVAVLAEAQQPKKVPRIGTYQIPIQPVNPLVPRQFGWLCRSAATEKDRTSPPSPDVRRGGEKSDAINICYTRQSLPSPKRAITRPRASCNSYEI